MQEFRIEYFASLREKSAKSRETFTSQANTAAQLYAELQSIYDFSLQLGEVRVAVNDAFVEAEHVLKANDKVVFIPPVAGG